MNRPLFRDRAEAGRALASKLLVYADTHPVIIGLPRGGLVVAREVAQALAAPLDIVVVRKIGHPDQPEYGIGAVSEEEFHWFDEGALASVSIEPRLLERMLKREADEVRRRAALYRSDRPPLPLEGRTVILVDDGLATGVSARAAIHEVEGRGASRVVLAVPVASSRALADFLREEVVDEVVALSEPDPFYAVGDAYVDFSQTSDDEVVEILTRYPRVIDSTIQVQAGVELPSILTVPREPLGVVIFAHGSGSGRFSPRNRKIAQVLNACGFATLLFDLLAENEARFRGNVFDVPLLAGRLLAATRWVREVRETRGLPIGYFGASTGAAAALSAAADPQAEIVAIVSRGGRVDLSPAIRHASRRAIPPTLLIVGGADDIVLELNRWAMARLPHADLRIIEGAGHLFEEFGAMEQVSRLASEWFGHYFMTSQAPTRHRAA